MGRSHNTVRRGVAFSVVKKVLLAGCMLGIGMVAGAFLIGHQAFLEPPGSEGEVRGAGTLTRFRRALARTLTEEPITTGALYVRWGRSVCPPDASGVYAGVMGGGRATETGGGSEYLCLVEKPEWGNYDPIHNAYSSIWGVEFKEVEKIFDKDNAEKFMHHDANCAVCRSSRSVQLMIPGRKTCMEGWTEEYHGYLMSSRYNDAGQRNYVCVDHAPEADKSGYLDQGGASLWPVEAYCGSLPCPEYVQGRELTCVVCSQ